MNDARHSPTGVFYTWDSGEEKIKPGRYSFSFVLSPDWTKGGDIEGEMEKNLPASTFPFWSRWRQNRLKIYENNKITQDSLFPFSVVQNPSRCRPHFVCLMLKETTPYRWAFSIAVWVTLTDLLHFLATWQKVFPLATWKPNIPQCKTHSRFDIFVVVVVTFGYDRARIPAIDVFGLTDKQPQNENLRTNESFKKKGGSANNNYRLDSEIQPSRFRLSPPQEDVAVNRKGGRSVSR